MANLPFTDLKETLTTDKSVADEQISKHLHYFREGCEHSFLSLNAFSFTNNHKDANAIIF